MEYRQLGNTDVKIPAIGMGTWQIGGGLTADYTSDEEAVRALRAGIELGMTLIDTAEMYGKGHSEEIVGEAIRVFQRDSIFIVTKVLPENLRYNDLVNSAYKSLRRLNTEYIDLYLIHAPNPRIPIKESMQAMERLVTEGIVRFIGVSNFSVTEMEQARSCLSNTDIVANQVEYSLIERRIEINILPYCQKNKITVMAYCPLARGILPKNQFLREIGLKYGKTAAQVALNWLIHKEGVVAIPKAIKIEHIRENAASTEWRLSKEDIILIEKYFS